MGRLEGKVAFVTGAGSGVGRATALLFAREGAAVAAVGRTLAKVEETAQAAGERCVALRCDVSESADVQAALAATVERFGALHVIVNNAAIGYAADASDEASMREMTVTSEEDWQHVLDINLTSVFLTGKYGVPEIVRSGGGAVVNVASVGGLRGMDKAHTYSAAKAGMVNLTRSMALTYGRRGVRVNCVAPGAIDTPMIAPRLAAAGKDDYAAALPGLGRLAEPEEIAYPILWLASEEASYVNGAVLVVDGGATA